MENEKKDITSKEPRKNDTAGNHKELKGMIKVVPSFLWLALIGASAVIIVIIVGTALKWSVTTVVMTGVFHPNASEHGEVLCFPNIASAKEISEGMRVTVNLNDGSGYLKGEVTFTEEYVTSTEEMMNLLGDQSLVNVFNQNAPVVLVVCKLIENPGQKCGYEWVGPADQEPDRIKNGTFFSVAVATDNIRPLARHIYE